LKAPGEKGAIDFVELTAVLRELAHGFEMNRAEIPSCTANFFILYCITPVCLLWF